MTGGAGNRPDGFGSGASVADAVHRKAAIAVPFRDFGFLQQFQRASTGANEYELRRNHLLFAGPDILYGHSPAPIFETLEVDDLVVVGNREARLRLQMVDQQMGERATGALGRAILRRSLPRTPDRSANRALM
jgi:hypothetical protein